uniref:Uncharacterized protein n=1 Tax=Octopus bimaculoides TaxID=37653 RepID=A0A0L8GKD1_OCTBM
MLQSLFCHLLLLKCRKFPKFGIYICRSKLLRRSILLFLIIFFLSSFLSLSVKVKLYKIKI